MVTENIHADFVTDERLHHDALIGKRACVRDLDPLRTVIIEVSLRSTC